MKTVRHTTAGGIALLAATLCLAGCSSLGDIPGAGGASIRVESEPAGATVLADGTALGVTPLEFVPGDVFRAGFTASDDGLLGYRYLGRLTVRKPGCSEYVTEVDDRLLSDDIHVQLDCSVDAQREAPAAGTVPPPAGPAAETAEQRLRRIGDLHEKGLLSDDEHRLLRQRVLDTL